MYIWYKYEQNQINGCFPCEDVELKTMNNCMNFERNSKEN